MSDITNDAIGEDHVDRFLKHFGVLGMKWGVRKDEDRVTKRTSSEHEQAREQMSRATKGLSNAELKALNERLKLEREYRTLASADAQKGLDWVKTLTAAGTTIAALYALSNTELGKDIAKAITKKR